ncbi:MAG: amidohydrolase family protein [Phycisphaerae bacterium]
MILAADWVAPVCAPPIRDGYVEIAAERIVAVGAQAALPPPIASTVMGEHVAALSADGGEFARAAQRDAALGGASAGDVLALGSVVLTPGLVNAHTHLELTAYADQLAPAPFWDWIRRLIPLRAAPGQHERESQGAYDGAWQSLRAGVTCVGDISRLNLHWRVLRNIPIRKVCYVELLSIADSPPRTPDELRIALDEVVEDDLLTVGVSPHAPYTVPREHFCAAVALAADRGRPWCAHWAETREEVAFIGGDADALPAWIRDLVRSGGIAPAAQEAGEYLQACVGGTPAGLLAHGNYLTDADIARIAGAGHSVVYCPRAHAFFQHEAHPLARLRAAGVRVVLGTDSRASNWSLSLLEEARHVAEHVRGAPSANELLGMITRDAALAIGLENQIGVLEAGRLADVAAFPLRGATDEPLAELVRSAPAPVGVWVAGRRVV